MLNLATAVSEPDAAPEPGDVTVCVKCVATLVFTPEGEKLGLRLCTSEEEAELAKHHEVLRTKTAIIAAARKVGWDLS